MKNRKIIITGGAGEVGLNLINLINKKKYQVIVIDKNKHNINIAKKISSNIDCYCYDLSKKGEWEDLFKNAYCVVQLQAQISSSYKKPYIKNNIHSVRNVVEVCEKNKIKNLIHLSSSVVISVAKDHYTNTKRIGEEIVKKSNVPHIILRPSLMYGCFDIKHLGFLKKFFFSPIYPIPGSGKYIRQPLFVEDMCNVIINSIEKKKDNSIHNIIGKERIYFINLLRLLAKKLNKKIIFFPLPLPAFNIMLKFYSSLFSKNPLIPEQLTALMAGDRFPVSDWDKVFNVEYTPYKKGLKKMIESPYFEYGKMMKKD